MGAKTLAQLKKEVETLTRLRDAQAERLKALNAILDKHFGEFDPTILDEQIAKRLAETSRVAPSGSLAKLLARVRRVIKDDYPFGMDADPADAIVELVRFMDCCIRDCEKRHRITPIRPAAAKAEKPRLLAPGVLDDGARPAPGRLAVPENIHIPYEEKNPIPCGSCRFGQHFPGADDGWACTMNKHRECKPRWIARLWEPAEGVTQ